MLQGTEQVLMNLLAYRIYKLKENGVPIWKPISKIYNLQNVFNIYFVFCLQGELMDHTEERCQNLEEWKMFQHDTVDVLKQDWT